MAAFNPQPWRVSVEEYTELNDTLEMDDQLKALSFKLTKRLSNGTKYGHVAAWLYGTWAKRVGQEAVRNHWIAYDKWRSEEQEQFETPKAKAVPTPTEIPKQIANDMFDDPPF